MEQWQRYQDERSPVSPSLRQYNVNDYVCFVCHVKTYRKRIRALRVMVSSAAAAAAAAAVWSLNITTVALEIGTRTQFSYQLSTPLSAWQHAQHKC